MKKKKLRINHYTLIQREKGAVPFSTFRSELKKKIPPSFHSDCSLTKAFDIALDRILQVRISPIPSLTLIVFGKMKNCSYLYVVYSAKIQDWNSRNSFIICHRTSKNEFLTLKNSIFSRFCLMPPVCLIFKGRHQGFGVSDETDFDSNLNSGVTTKFDSHSGVSLKFIDSNSAVTPGLRLTLRKIKLFMYYNNFQKKNSGGGG